MSREILTLDLQRQEKTQPWGFRIIGGTDEALLLKVYKVSEIIWRSRIASKAKINSYYYFEKKITP